MKVLKARLYELEQTQEQAKIEQARGLEDRHRLGQPDPLLRPPPLPDGQGSADRVETGDTDRVLDGDLDEFVKAALVLRKKSGTRPAPRRSARRSVEDVGFAEPFDDLPDLETG